MTVGIMKLMVFCLFVFFFLFFLFCFFLLREWEINPYKKFRDPRGLCWIQTESVEIWLRPLGNACCLFCQLSKCLMVRVSIWLVFRRSWLWIPTGSLRLFFGVDLYLALSAKTSICFQKSNVRVHILNIIMSYGGVVYLRLWENQPSCYVQNWLWSAVGQTEDPFWE